MKNPNEIITYIPESFFTLIYENYNDIEPAK